MNGFRIALFRFGKQLFTDHILYLFSVQEVRAHSLREEGVLFFAVHHAPLTFRCTAVSYEFGHSREGKIHIWKFIKNFAAPKSKFQVYPEMKRSQAWLPLVFAII